MNDLYVGLAEILEIDVEEVNSGLNLEELSWDSLAIVSTIALVDDCFNVMLDGKSLADCKTVADIESLINSKKG